jgi:hypothetical protein
LTLPNPSTTWFVFRLYGFCSAVSSLEPEQGVKAIEKRYLGWLNVQARLFEREPIAPVCLRDLDAAPGVWWPLDLAGITPHLSWIAVSLKGPGCDDLSSCLLDPAQVQKMVSGGKAGLLLKFSLGGVERLFAFVVFTLGNGPGTLIFLGKVRAARMNKEDFQMLESSAIHDQACAASGHAASIDRKAVEDSAQD